MKVLLSGYYGFDNAGDDAVLYAIVHTLREVIPDVDITVLSNQPEKTAEQFQVKAVNRWGKKDIFHSVRECDLLISGGGSLLQDVTSRNGILYYLGIIKLAQMMRKKVIVYAQGVGPINDSRNRSLTAKILNKVNAITVRDFDSRNLLMEIGVYKEILVSVDPVLGIPPKSIDEKKGQNLLKSAGWDAEKKTVMVSVRNWKYSERFFKAVAESCEECIRSGKQVVLVPFHYPEDVEAGDQVASLMKEKPVVLRENYGPEDTMAILKNADIILGMRLHSLIMGAALLKPLIALSYDPKVTSFMQLLRYGECFSIDSVDAHQITEAVKRAETEDENKKQLMEQTVEIMSHQAKAPAMLVSQI